MILHAGLAPQVKSGMIPHNPVDGVEKPSTRDRKPVPIWTDEQIGAFLNDAVRGEWCAPFWFFCLCEGMRRAEALGLRWRDLV